MKIKNMVLGVAAVALISTSAFADGGISNAPKLSINGLEIADIPYNDVMISDNMLPVRKVCEALGAKVEWNDEKCEVTIKTTNYSIAFVPNKDEYTINGSEKLSLGVTSVLCDDTTYVPKDFVEKFFNANISYADGKIEIQDKKEESSEVIYLSKDEGRYLVYDINRGRVSVNITDESEICDESGAAFDISNLKEGQVFDIEYADFMTMSLPPITNAVKITVKDDELRTVLDGTVCLAEKNESGLQITIGDKNDVDTQTILNCVDDTKVLSTTGKTLADVKEGVSITAVASLASTKSIPAQKTAFAIIIND